MKKGSDNYLLGSAGYTVLYADCMQLFRQTDSDDYILLWNERQRSCTVSNISVTRACIKKKQTFVVVVSNAAIDFVVFVFAIVIMMLVHVWLLT